MNKKWTITAIADRNETTGHFYFSKNTLRHFKQSRSSFKVLHPKNGRIFVFALRGKVVDGERDSYSFAEFLPESGEVRSISNPRCLFWKSPEDIKAYIFDECK